MDGLVNDLPTSPFHKNMIKTLIFMMRTADSLRAAGRHYLHFVAITKTAGSMLLPLARDLTSWSIMLQVYTSTPAAWMMDRSFANASASPGAAEYSPAVAGEYM